LLRFATGAAKPTPFEEGKELSEECDFEGQQQFNAAAVESTSRTSNWRPNFGTCPQQAQLGESANSRI